MSAMAVFKACFSDWKLVKTRGVVQVIFEVPLAESDLAYQVVDGMPDAAQERWFAIARLDTNKIENGDAAPSRGSEADLEDKPGSSDPRPTRKRTPPTAEKRLAAQAGMICAERPFQVFLCEKGHASLVAEEHAKEAVHIICGVNSRREIVPGSPAATRWDKLHAEYLVWNSQ